MNRPLSLPMGLTLLLAAIALACTTSPPPSPPASPTPAATDPATPTPTADGVTPAPGVTPPSVTPPGTTPTPTPDVPSPTPEPPPTPPGTVTSPAQAAALVLASDPRFYSVGPPRDDVVGQCCWVQPFPDIGGYVVRVEIGWGDCPAGCIHQRQWLFRVTPDFTVTLLEEEGDQPIQREPPTGSGPAAVTIEALKGPICPVEQQPPDPACAPQPVDGAEVILRDPLGIELQRASTDAQGRIVALLPAGAYYFEALPVEGLMGTPEPVAFSVAPGDQFALRLEYDTGIR